MMKTLYITRSGKLVRRQNTLVVIDKKGKRYSYPVENIEDIHTFSHLTVTSATFKFLSKRRIPLHFYDYYGNYIGTFHPKEYIVSGFTLVNQVKHYYTHPERLFLAKNILLGALKSMKKTLSDFHVEASKLELYKSPIENAKNIQQLMGAEGTLRNFYLSILDTLIENPTFHLGKRSRRPPANYGNALMSYLNSVVYGTTLTQIYHTHLDPRVGYLHETGYRRFPLSLDIAEIFKPLIADRLLITLVNSGEIKKGHFIPGSKGILLSTYGKKRLLQNYDNLINQTFYHPRSRRKISLKRLIRMEVYRIEKHIIGDETYSPSTIPDIINFD